MITTTPEPVPWVVDQLVTKGGLTILAGLAGQGKSLLSQAVALAAVSPDGGAAAGLAVEPCRVLIVDAKNGSDEIHRRVHLLGLSLERVDRLEIVEADGFRSLWPAGAENDSEEVSPVLAGLRNLVRRQDIATILIHHSPKNGTTYRGSSAIAASCECVFILERVEGDDDLQRRRLRCEKCRPAPEPPARWIRLATEQELAEGFRPIREADPFMQSERERMPATAALARTIVGLLSSHGPMRRADIARLTDHKPSDGTLRRAVALAADEGKLVQRDDERYEVASHDCNPAGNPTRGVASQPASHRDLAHGNPAGPEPGHGPAEINGRDPDVLAIGGQRAANEGRTLADLTDEEWISGFPGSTFLTDYRRRPAGRAASGGAR